VITVETGGATLRCLVDGPDDAPAALLVHGFPDCWRSFRHQVAPLVDAGLRVARPSLRGYAPSSLAHDRRYDAAALADDLVAIADAVSPDRPVRLVGHDWGAIAAYAATARAPHRFSHVVTMAVPHLRVAGPRFLRPTQLRRSWYMLFFQLRGLAETRAARDDFALIRRLVRDWSPGWSAPDDELRAITDALSPRAHLEAALSYYRALGRGSSSARRALFSRTRVPALYLHGVDDGCVGVELADGVESAYVAPVTVVRVAGAGHFLHQERPEIVTPIVRDFLLSEIAPDSDLLRPPALQKVPSAVRPT
jgi:pimeloyl-ACP methyl ester carboxylesterase